MFYAKHYSLCLSINFSNAMRKELMMDLSMSNLKILISIKLKANYCELIELPTDFSLSRKDFYQKICYISNFLGFFEDIAKYNNILVMN